MSTPKILVTGGTSFVGRAVVSILLGLGWEVVATFRSTRPTGDRPGLTWHQVDWSATGDLAALRQQRWQAVVHLAATSPQVGTGMRTFLYDNGVATSNVVDFAVASGCERFIYASSLSIHGDVTGPVVDENTPRINPCAYGIGKYIGERLLQDVADKLPAIALRLPAVVGPGASRHWLWHVAQTLAAGKTLTMFNPDAAFNNLAHVSDLGAFISRLARAPLQGFQAFPVGARGTMTVRNVVDLIRTGLASTSEVRVVPAPKPSFTIDWSRAAEFGYDPQPVDTLLNLHVAEFRGAR